MKISIIGTGYVGLVTGVCLAETGHSVVCVDRDMGKIEQIGGGKLPIYEPGLEELLQKNLQKGSFRATADLARAIMETDITIIAVGTPIGKNGHIDLEQIKEVSRDIGAVLKGGDGYHVVVVKSTVVPSTTDSVVLPILEKASGKKLGDFGLCMNPEFLREGSAVDDFLHPDRVVIGSVDDRSFAMYEKVYAPFRCPIIKSNLRTAEMMKYTTNALLASFISFSNEIASICEEVGGIDAEEVFHGVHLDERFMPSHSKEDKSYEKRIRPGMVAYLKPGCGYGGSCFPKDIQALYSFSRKVGHTPKMLESILAINKNQPSRLAKRLEVELGGFEDKKVVVWGLTFKPNTDDVRETPAKPFVEYLIGRGAQVHCFDPVTTDNMRTMFVGGSVTFSENSMDPLEDAHALVVLTAWDHFRGVDFSYIAQRMRDGAVLVDGRRIYDRRSVEKANLRYIGVGYRNNQVL